MTESTEAPASATPDKISARNLVKRYGDNEVVKGVSVEVHAGEVVGLLGPNGAGKTTTFKMIVGFAAPTAGEVFYNDRDITQLPIHRRARLGIAYLPQQPSVFRNMTVRENLMAVMQSLGYSKKEIRPRVEELVQELGIDSLQKRVAGKLSGGEQRRVEIARALMPRPKFILLDEPFTGIDPTTVEDIQGIIRRLAAKGYGILITDHNVRETLNITDRSYVMLAGKMEVSGSMEDVLNSQVIREKYLTSTIVSDLSRAQLEKQ